MLQFDWEEVEGKAVSEISGQAAKVLDDGSICWTAIAVIIGGLAVTIEIDPDTDELSVGLKSVPTSEAWVPIDALAKYRSKKLGWCLHGAWLRFAADGSSL